MAIQGELVRRRGTVLGAFSVVLSLVVACGGQSRHEGATPGPGDAPNEIRHVAVRPRVTLASASAAFAGDVLGVAASSYWATTYPDVALAIERDGDFELVELGNGESPTLAASDDEFHVAWIDWSSPGGGLRLARVATDGSVRGSTEVLSPFANSACRIATNGAVDAIACSNLVAICDSGTCRVAELEECGAWGARAIWDGEAFSFVRACSDGAAGTFELRYGRLSTTADWIRPESGIVAVSFSEPGGSLQGSSPALHAQDGRLLVAWMDSLFAFDTSGTLLGTPTWLSRTRSYSPLSLYYELTASDDRIVLTDGGCDGGLEQNHGDNALSLFDVGLAPVGSPSVVDGSCGAVSVAGSASGRTVLVRPSPGSLLVEDVELDGTRSSPRLVAEPTSEPMLRGATCTGDGCRLALYEAGVETEDPSLADRLQRVDVNRGELDRSDLSPSCSSLGCSILFTAAGDTIVYEPPALRYLDGRGAVLWERDVPTSFGVITLADPDAPWAAGADAEHAWRWRLGPNGPEEWSFEGRPFGGAYLADTTIACNDDTYAHRYANERIEIFRLESGGLGPSLGTLPARNRILCAGGMFLTFSDAPNEPVVSRLLPDGTSLPDETLEAGIIDAAPSGDSIVLLLRSDDGQESWLPSQAPIAAVLTPDGGLRTLPLELPEPGLFGFSGSFVSFYPSVQVRPEATYLVWRAKSALMLSSFPTLE